MKTVIINGSPRKNGNTSELISILSSHLTSDVEIIDTYNVNVSACIDCRHCMKSSACSISDDMQKYYGQIASADNIVIASPLYFSELTGKLLSFTSRFQFFFSSKYIRKDFKDAKRKKGAVILVGGGSSKTTEKAMSTAAIILEGINAEIVSSIAYINTDTAKAVNDKKTIKAIYDMADILNGD